VISIGPESVKLTVAEGDLEIPNDDVFVLIGGEPPYPFLQRIGIRFGGSDNGSGTSLAPVAAARA
jgi:hypothetical protein